jgi:serine/threonine protein kinase
MGGYHWTMPEENKPTEPPAFDVPSLEAMNAYLPQFRFEKLAACGGMGAVYKAYQESLDRRVAVKILPPDFGAEKEFADRFKVEARAMAKLNHTNIVGVYDFGITGGGHLYLVMEWIEGRSLHELIHQGNLSLRKATNLAMQLCEALTFAHEHQIIHRDIKPGNIMVNDADHVKVADFGLARPNTGEAEDENPYGTPDYAAPEIYGGSVVDHRVDIYAVGVVLYEMLTGTVPGDPRRSVTEFAKISPRWDSIVAKAIDPDPEKRYQDAGEFRAHINVAMKQGAEPGGGAGNPIAIDLGIGLGEGLRTPAVPQKRNPAPPAKKSAVSMTQQQQVQLVVAVVAVVLVGVLGLIFWPSSRSVTSSGVGVEATPEEIQQVMAKLEQSDPELARLVSSFGDDWKAAGAANNPASPVAEKLRAAQNAAVQSKAKERAEAARRAEIVAAELAKLKSAPSIKALKEAAAR